MDSASLHHIRCQSAYHRNDYKYYFYEIHTSVSTFLSNRFSVKREAANIIFRFKRAYAWLHHYFDDVCSNKTKMWFIVLFFALSLDISQWNIYNLCIKRGKWIKKKQLRRYASLRFVAEEHIWNSYCPVTNSFLYSWARV